MELASLIHQYHDGFIDKYGDKALPGHLRALGAIQRCRTPESGELYIQCPDCDHAEWRPLSCGNRHCPKCQNHQSSLWIDKQQENYCRCHISWQRLPYRLNCGNWHGSIKKWCILFYSNALPAP